MMLVNIQKAEGHLVELVRQAVLGEEEVLMVGDTPTVRLVAMMTQGACRKPGTARDDILFMAPDFDEPLDDFQEYAP